MRRTDISFAALAVIFAPGGLAAYVQFKECSNSGLDGNSSDAPQGLEVDSLRASIAHQHNGGTQLKLDMTSYRPDWKTCDDDAWKGRYASTLRIATLRHLPEYEGVMKRLECLQVPSHSPTLSLSFTYDIADPLLLESYFLTVKLRTENDKFSACVIAPLTPDIGSPTTTIAIWAPIITLILVVLAAFMHETTSIFITGQQDETSSGGSGARGTNDRSHITHIADCISYLQFIFFSSAFSLSYPGFLQPVASEVSWSTLMLPNGVVVGDSWYDGVRDGLYEINGTFGGTYGMELMTQVMGGTITRDTWLNLIALAAIIFALLTSVSMLGERLIWTRDWFQASYTLEFRHGEEVGIRATIWKIMRLFCSYFLLPLVAWTTYQLSYATLQPTYHTIGAVAVISGTLLIIWWALSQASPRSLGYLTLSTTNQGEEKVYDSLQRENMHATGFFLLLIARGATIGGLQMMGMVQLLVMIAIETVQIALHVIVFRTSSAFWSRTGLMPVIRLTVLIVQTAFLPDFAEFTTRMVVGYIVGSIHALVLIGLFILPAILNLACLAHIFISRWLLSNHGSSDEDQKPQIYGLRQLVRRPTNPESHRVVSDGGSSTASLSPSLISPGPVQSLPKYNSTYFRQPRSTTSLSTLPLKDVSSARGSSSETTTSEGSVKTDENDDLYEDGRKTAYNELPEPSPLNSKVDYSVREADLYYVRPRRHSFRQAKGEPKATLKHKISSMLGR